MANKVSARCICKQDATMKKVQQATEALDDEDTLTYGEFQQLNVINTYSMEN